MSAILGSADSLAEEERQCHETQLLNWKEILIESGTRRRLQLMARVS